MRGVWKYYDALTIDGKNGSALTHTMSVLKSSSIDVPHYTLDSTTAECRPSRLVPRLA
jgi:hypothetical protein